MKKGYKKYLQKVSVVGTNVSGNFVKHIRHIFHASAEALVGVCQIIASLVAATFSKTIPVKIVLEILSRIQLFMNFI